MAQVIGASELKTSRKPAIHVNAPMEFFRRDQINHPANEDTRENRPEPRQKANQQCGNAVSCEQEKNVLWRVGKCDVFWCLRRSYPRVMFAMPCAERITRVV